MAAWKVKNPTHRTKAVRARGGISTISPGETDTFDDAWSDDQVARYRAAGLTISEAKPSEKPKGEGKPVPSSKGK